MKGRSMGVGDWVALGAVMFSMVVTGGGVLISFGALKEQIRVLQAGQKLPDGELLVTALTRISEQNRRTDARLEDHDAVLDIVKGLVPKVNAMADDIRSMKDQGIHHAPWQWTPQPTAPAAAPGASANFDIAAMSEAFRVLSTFARMNTILQGASH